MDFLAFKSNFREQFFKNGYLVLENFWQEEECLRANNQSKYLLKTCQIDAIPTVFNTDREKHVSNKYFLDSAEKISFFFETSALNANGQLTISKEQAINKIGHALHEHDPVFSKLTYSNKFASLLDSIGYLDPVCLQSMLIFKQPRIGGKVAIHQDSSFLLTSPNTLIGFWLALEDVTISNGCLWVMPMGHTTPMWERFGFDENHQEVSFLWKNNSGIDQSSLIPLEVKKGSLVVLHAMLPHMSFANESDKSRWAYTFHCMESSSSCDPFNWLQRKNSFVSFKDRLMNY